MKKVLTVIGLLCLAGALFFGYFTLDRFSERDKAEERLAQAAADAHEAVAEAERASDSDAVLAEARADEARWRTEELSLSALEVERFEGYAYTNLSLSIGLLVVGIGALVFGRRRGSAPVAR